MRLDKAIMDELPGNVVIVTVEMGQIIEGLCTAIEDDVRVGKFDIHYTGEITEKDGRWIYLDWGAAVFVTEDSIVSAWEPGEPEKSKLYGAVGEKENSETPS